MRRNLSDFPLLRSDIDSTPCQFLTLLFRPKRLYPTVHETHASIGANFYLLLLWRERTVPWYNSMLDGVYVWNLLGAR